ncbi:hypothetical protein A2V80_00470 [Candidatus Woesebacteria bacterium RBG_16_39_8b]|uniref:Uncharacterized protein n=1 Tax=Candidatus Woesebacteria bacterium RBG_16_39_8b TaxID=1802482 RepID=A0A1F7XDG9_9BACT|nr:MAG: hypothetical protein A2V80_00470 [Candidatus Woesebacteria bacterium RBG_16_39_8b]
MDTEEKWQNQPPESKQSSIIEELSKIELQAVDPDFMSRYHKAKTQTTDQADLMRTDLAFMDKLHKLRGEGKISTVSKLKEKSKDMVNMNPNELRKAFHDYSEELKATVNSTT